MAYMKKQINLENQMNKIYTILDELQYAQVDQFVSIQKNQSIIIKKIGKLQEYNEIDDMTNAVFDKRLLNIEKKLEKI